LQDGAVVRLKEGRLAWYSPGAGDAPRFLDESDAREAFLAAQALPGSTAYFAVPGADARLCQLEVSAQEKKHIQKSLPFMLEEGLVADIEELHFSSLMQGKTSMAVAVCSVEKMAQWQALLADFPGINHWLPEPLVLPWNEGEWCVVVDGGTAIVRTGPSAGFSVELNTLGIMLESARLDSTPPQAIIVYGQNQSEDTAYVPSSLQQRVQWRRGELGSALMLAQNPGSALNLLQGDFGARLPLARWAKQWRAVAAVVGIAFCVQLGATYAELAALERENLALRQAVEQSYRKAYPRGAMVDPEKQLKRQLGALRGSSQTGGFVSLLSSVGEVINSNPGTDIASINYNQKGDEIRMNITAKDYEAVESIRTAMTSAGLRATMESSNAQGDKVRARLRVGAGS